MLDILESIDLSKLSLKDLTLLLKIINDVKNEEIEVLEWKIKL